MAFVRKCIDTMLERGSDAIILMENKQPVMRIDGKSVLISKMVVTKEHLTEFLTGDLALPAESLEEVPLTEEILGLRDAYLAAEILGPRWREDATHVAAATVARADAIVSWNFRHIVRLDKIKAYNQINLLHGYGILTIVSPKEVNVDEPEDAE